MALKNIQEFIEKLEIIGELKRISKKEVVSFIPKKVKRAPC